MTTFKPGYYSITHNGELIRVWIAGPSDDDRFFIGVIRDTPIWINKESISNQDVTLSWPFKPGQIVKDPVKNKVGFCSEYGDYEFDLDVEPYFRCVYRPDEIKPSRLYIPMPGEIRAAERRIRG